MDNYSTYVILLVICLVLSGFFSGTETALTALSPAKTKQILGAGGRSVRALKLWLKHPNRVLTTILVGNNAVNVLSTALATVLAEYYFGNMGITIATFGMTIALLVFGEVTPKTFAKHNAVSFAPKAMLLLFPFYWVVSPIVFVFSWFAAKIVKLFGGQATSHGPAATEEDIEFMIRLGHQEGVLERDEGELLESVIEFGDTIVREVMVPRPDICAFDVQSSLLSIYGAIQDQGHSRIPIFDGAIDNIVGVLHAKDLIPSLTLPNSPEVILKNIIRPALFVPETMKIGSLLKEFKRGNAHLAIVADEYGGTDGIITLEDVIEELVGDILDEHDSEDDVGIKKTDDENFCADGKVNVHDIGEALEIEFPENQPYDSVGGFIADSLGKIPHIGDKIEYSGWEFLIKEADKKRVLQVAIKRIQAAIQ